ncbi:MAG: peptidoglycan DD-metalloendopeptidase family protein [Alphaproteobacteria bacterium]|nr:peptidoglycan DD-metalloendopeptidase family protein [Alphaproteobacteria bacterium]
MDQISPVSDAHERPSGLGAHLAVATSLAVMFAGAGFLFYVIGAAPQPAAAQSKVARLERSPVAAAGPAEPKPAAASGPADAPAAPVSLEDELLRQAPDGPTPRLSPLHAAQTQAQEEPAPRLKPARSANADARAALGAPPLVRLGQSLLADPNDRPPPVFSISDITPVHAPAPLPVVYAGDVTERPHTVRVAMKKGEAFVDALARAGVRAADRNAAAYALAKYQNLRALLPGDEFALTVAKPNETLFQLASATHAPETYLIALAFRTDAQSKIVLSRRSDGGFEARKQTVDLTSRLVSVKGRINGSLYQSAKAAGAPDNVIADLANMFAYDIDFQREVLNGDRFEAIYQVNYDESGRVVSTGDILYGRLTWRGGRSEKGYYLFNSDENGGRSDYFDRNGHSARRLLMKTPVDATRISSGFGSREHPILGYVRMHKGVDFAAPRGTPVKAAGDGIVERANRYGSFGNYIRIRHANGYQTIYGHLNGFARGIHAGSRVKQGQIIAYVGTTGRSTGPHLHYEVHLNGKAVNPMHLKMATGVSLHGAELNEFDAIRDAIDALRAPEPNERPLYAERDQSAAL